MRAIFAEFIDLLVAYALPLTGQEDAPTADGGSWPGR